eukprot:2641065-Rhodomonas_salina.2
MKRGLAFLIGRRCALALKLDLHGCHRYESMGVSEPRILKQVRLQTLDPRPETLNPGHQTLDPELWTLDPRPSALNFETESRYPNSSSNNESDPKS